MAYWRDPVWQHRTADAISSALDDVHTRLLPQNLGNSEWTKAVVQAVNQLTSADCSCAFKGSTATDHYSGGEWLFDLTWIAHRDNPRPNEAAFVSGIPLILECEWLDWRHVWDDFDKLLLPRCGLRVMVIQKCANTPEDWAERLFERAAAFGDADPNDAWLIGCWSRTGFEFRRLVGSVRD